MTLKRKKRRFIVLALLILLGIGIGAYVIFADSGPTEDKEVKITKKEIPEWQKRAFQRGVFGTVTLENRQRLQAIADATDTAVGGAFSQTGFYSEVENIAYFSAWLTPQYFYNLKRQEKLNEYGRPNSAIPNWQDKILSFPRADGTVTELSAWELEKYVEQPIIIRVHNPKLLKGYEVAPRYNEFYNTQVANPIIHDSLNEAIYIEYIETKTWNEWQRVGKTEEYLGDMVLLENSWKDINFVMALQPNQISTTGELIDFQGMRKYTFQEFLDSVDSTVLDIEGNEITLNLDEITFIDI
jgi:hypothetical protein